MGFEIILQWIFEQYTDKVFEDMPVFTNLNFAESQEDMLTAQSSG